MQIAQRETLRQFYCAVTAEEQLQIVEAAATQGNAVLNLHTALHLLCHLAELAAKGALPGDAAAQAALLEAIYVALAPHVEHLTPPQLGALLWSLAAVGQPAAWTDALLHEAARRELARGRVPSYSTKELSSLLWACGRLARTHDPELQVYATAMADELGRRLEAQPYVRSALSCTDMADLAQAAALLYVVRPAEAAAKAGAGAEATVMGAAGWSACSEAEGGPLGTQRQQQQQQQHPHEVQALCAAMANVVRQRLANKSSAASPFMTRDLLRFLSSYAALGHCSEPQTQRMLDVVASWVR